MTKEFSPERRRRIDEIKTELLAEKLKVNQPAVSKLEQRADVYISSLRSYIEAVGGKLKIVADFPEGEVANTNFADVGEDQGA